MRRRIAVVALSVLVLLALVGGVTAFVSVDKTVTLSVDGEDRTVRSFSKTVGDVLDKEGISTGEHDIVAPARDAMLEEGDRISVRFGRRVQLTVDGQSRELWVTAQSVQEVLDQVGVRTEGAYLSASRSMRVGRAGLSLTLRTARDVTVVADAKRRPLTTNVATVREVLAAAKVTLRPQDKLSSALTAYPVDGQVITVTRLDTRTDKDKRSLPFATKTQRTEDMYEGETRVERAGEKGVEVLVYSESYVDGKRTSRKLVSRTTTRPPVSKIVQVGTKERPPPPPPPAPRPSGGGNDDNDDDNNNDDNDDDNDDNDGGSGGGGNAPSADGLNWGALAQCESGGNPRAVNPSGRYFGLYQFSLPTWASVGGSGNPIDASPSEQTYRAQILYNRSGAGQWPTCGRLLFT